MVYTMMVTTVTLATAAKFEKAVPATFEEAEKLGLRHVLVIDLKAEIRQYADDEHSDVVVIYSGYGNDYNDMAAVDDADLYPLFLKKLRKIVQADASTAHPSIDAIQILYLSCADSPSHDLAEALDGLQPRHLELECGWYEHCDLHHFDSLHNPFPLQSLVIHSACGDELHSTLLPQVDTLRLALTHDVHFLQTGLPMALRTLVIFQNNAIDTFCRLKEETNMTDMLQCLRITSTSGNDFTTVYNAHDFFELLETASSILELELSLCDYPRFADYISYLPLWLPASLESFVFSGTPGSITDPEPWFACTSDPDWLPGLEKFSFRLDASVAVHMNWDKHGEMCGDAGVDIADEQLVHAIRASLSACRSEVEIVD